MLDDAGFWKFIAVGYCLSSTLCFIMCFEIAFLGRPYLSLFLIIFALLLYINFKLLKH